MAEQSLSQIVAQLRAQPGLTFRDAAPALSQAKLLLLQLSALMPTAVTPAPLVKLARDTYELGALACIRDIGRQHARDSFVRYVQQLQPLFELAPPDDDARSKITGLYLLLLLTEGRYAEFHSELERLAAARHPDWEIAADRFLAYPVRLERWLMEGSYDRVWRALQSREVPCEEFSVFSEILTRQIRSEIASSSERAYPSLPLSSTKALLFLESEGAVVTFARQRGWLVRDGYIFFPDPSDATAPATSAAAMPNGSQSTVPTPVDTEFSRMTIEKTLGYARQLETIV